MSAATQADLRRRIVAEVDRIVGPAPEPVYSRAFPLADIEIRRSGDGRTVEAYCATFASAYEVKDAFGHYMEKIERTAFDQALRDGAAQTAMCLYNHGMNILDGKPDSMAQVPIGHPLEIRPDAKGLLTITRYNRGPFADQVLEAIRSGSIRAQSFRGKIGRSSPERVPPRRPGAPLPLVVRHQLGLTDYGPTPVPVNSSAAILAVRGRRRPEFPEFATYDEWRAWLRGEIARVDRVLAPYRAERARIRARHEVQRAWIRARLAR